MAKYKTNVSSKLWTREEKDEFNDYQRTRKYGLKIGEYKKMYEAQSGACKICEVKLDKLVVDHDHATGLVRALLCTTCNAMIGMAKDDPTILERGMDYLLYFCEAQDKDILVANENG